MIFLTVGTQFPFDRLVKAIDKACDKGLVGEEVFGQIGKSTYNPRNFKTVPFLAKDMFDQNLKRASAIIAHAGMGIISLALDHNKPLLVMPRLKKYNEVVNNHQFDIAKKFGELQHLLFACDEIELPERIKQLKSFVPQPREKQTKIVTDRIATFLNLLSKNQGAK